jgi:hypothetical protein
MTLLVEAPADTVGIVRPWLDAHAARRDVQVVRALPQPLPAGTQAVVRIGDPRCSPARALPGPVLAAEHGYVPAAWVPADEALATFARTAAGVVDRGEPAPVALLGQRSHRYARLTERLEANLQPLPTVRWTAERLTREDLLAALGVGLGLAVYLGHGRPTGWAAYRGMRGSHLLDEADRGGHLPLGGLFSVTCWTASRWRTRRSFAELTVASGRAAAALGSVRPVEHLASMRLVLAMAATLAGGARTVGDVLTGMAVPPAGTDAGASGVRADATTLRLVGDPLAPLAGAAGAAARAYAVVAPALDEPLDGTRPLPAGLVATEAAAPA